MDMCGVFARAALETLRTPSMPMLRALRASVEKGLSGGKVSPSQYFGDGQAIQALEDHDLCLQGWRAMIDAALTPQIVDRTDASPSATGD